LAIEYGHARAAQQKPARKPRSKRATGSIPIRSAFDRALELDSGHPAALNGLAALPDRPPQRSDFAVGQEVLSNRIGLGDVLDRYTVREVKRGGFGCVYIVDDPSGSRLAVKTFNTRYLWSDEDRARFEREAATWVRLDPHPNVVTARRVEKIEGLPCLVMGYIDGGDLEHLLGTTGLTTAGALDCAFQICDGMRHAADQLGLVHRDLKPANCMVSRDGQVKVTDFGLALAMRESQEQSPALIGAPEPVRVLYTTVAGTPVYMAPEQYLLGARLGPSTDVYAFGVILHEMLTGEIPPPGGRAKQFIAASPAAAALPAHVRELVLRCVEPNPADRPADFAEVRALLESVYRRVVGKPAPQAPEAETVDTAAWLERSIAFYELRLLDDALTAADRGLALNPAGEGERAAKFWHVRGMALYGFGRVPEALESYDQALELDSSQPSLWVCKGAALARLGRKAEGLECDERAIAITPDFATAWKYKAVALDGLGRREEAHAAFSRAYELNPRDAQVLSGWAANLRERGFLNESNDMVDRALAIEPRQVNAWIVKGNTMSHLNQLDDALECYERVLEIDPEDALALVNRASILSKLHRRVEADANLREQGRLEEALERTDRAMEITPDDELVWTNRARVLHLLGRRGQAAECLDRALSTAPEDPYVLEIQVLISST
jgi:tetratricopeptide (TPR) repeat protein